MSSIQILNQRGESAGEVELDEAVFGCQVRRHLFYDVVRMQLANRRNANPRTKTRSQVSGGGKKPYRQKGTGRARQGSIRSAHYRGGGVVFGPNGRKYKLKMPKRVRKEALKSALSLRNQDGNLIVLDQLVLDQYKTKSFAEIMAALGVESGLFVMGDLCEKARMSSKNLASTQVLPVAGLNVYDVLKYRKLVVTVPALAKIGERLKS